MKKTKAKTKLKPKMTIEEQLADLEDTKDIEDHQIRTKEHLDRFFRSMTDTIKKEAHLRKIGLLS